MTIEVALLAEEATRRLNMVILIQAQVSNFQFSKSILFVLCSKRQTKLDPEFAKLLKLLKAKTVCDMSVKEIFAIQKV